MSRTTDINVLIGKRIDEIEIDGFGILMTMDDGTVLDYVASDGGYSNYDIFTGADDEEL